MKNILPTIAFVTAFLVRYLMQVFPTLPPRFLYIGDVVIAGIAAIVIARLVVTRRMFAVPIRYLLLFLGFCYVVISATVLNQVSPEVTFAGVRNYFLYVPLFLLPFAYDYSASDLRKLLCVVLGLALLQIPAAFRQRFFEDAYATGDVVSGTVGFGGSGILSIFLVSTALMLISFFLGKRISAIWAVVFGLLVLLPTTINETKVTPILLLIGGFGLVYAKRRQINVRQIALIAGFAVLMVTIFVAVYDQLYPSRTGKGGYIDVVTSNSANVGLTGARVNSNAFSFAREPNLVVGHAPRLFEGESWVGRFDSLRMPFQVLLPNDVIHLLFGVGIGNVTSNFGAGGDYKFVTTLGGTKTTVTQLIWECGLLGAIIYLSFIAAVLKDALLVSTNPEWSDFGAGWTGICLVFLVVCFYLSLFMAPALLWLFTFFSGLVVSKARAHRGATPARVVSGSTVLK